MRGKVEQCDSKVERSCRKVESLNSKVEPFAIKVETLAQKKSRSFPLYEIEGESLPEVGDYQIVLNSMDEPVAIIQSYSIEIYPFNEVPVDFALAGGEGTYGEWKEAHVAFSGKGLKFTEEMLTVCDRFKKVFPK